MPEKKEFKSYLLNWIGGKRLLRTAIEPLIPCDIQNYIEPFGGGGWVLFYREKWAELEVYNDLDDRLVNLFRIVKYHPEALAKEFRFMIASRKMFKEALNCTTYTDVQRAAKFLYLISRSFGGKGSHFGTSKKSTGVKSQKNIIDRIAEISLRLDKVLIENLDFEDLIREYDGEETFFYCDPPYVTGEDYYYTTHQNGFDHTRLRDILPILRANFCFHTMIMSRLGIYIRIFLLLRWIDPRD